MTEKPEDRSGLVNAMADRCGADVPEAFRQGVIGPRRYRELLRRCATCAKSQECRGLLATTGGEALAAPDYCRNKDEIAALRERLDRALS